MTEMSHRSFLAAVQDFHRARRQAALQNIMARLTGKSADLLSFEEVRQKLKASGTAQPISWHFSHSG
jgi:hypothetical protein